MATVRIWRRSGPPDYLGGPDVITAPLMGGTPERGVHVVTEQRLEAGGLGAERAPAWARLSRPEGTSLGHTLASAQSLVGKRINPRCVKPLSWWQWVTAAIGNRYAEVCVRGPGS